MLDLIKTLKSFNRKERFYLVSQALGNKDFTLSDEFREQVGNKLNISIPSNAFAAMDYHLDWIYASLFAVSKGSLHFTVENKLELNKNQEDVDLFIAFKDDYIYHLILIEAKAESAWTNKQFESKAKKLKSIFGDKECMWVEIKLYFLITSPRKPRQLNINSLPSYLKRSIDDIWFKLSIPNDLVKITRCNEAGRASISGEYWKIESTKRKIKCPYCSSNFIAKIQYGYPNFSESLQNEIDEGKIILGGCCEEIGAPDKHCNNCNKNFLSNSAKDKHHWAAEEYFLGEGKLIILYNIVKMAGTH